jgi:hypothetical protein
MSNPVTSLTLPFSGVLPSEATVFSVTAEPLPGTIGGITGDAVHGQANGTGAGVLGSSTLGTGVRGTSQSAAGVSGSSVSGVGVSGASASNDAIQGTSQSSQHAGVSGTNMSGGFGLWGRASTGIGVYGASVGNDAIQGTSQSSQHAGVSGTNTGGGSGLWGDGGAAGIGVYAKGAQHAAVFDGHLQCNGDVHHTGTLTVDTEIVLSAAADFAEEFDLTGAVDAEPGTVMVLDGEGAVKPSCFAYDRKVAGIISGGGEYKPGIVLDKHASNRPRKALALVGKVYCKVDANYAPVEIGDMLTTSPTHGHAMKAVDTVKSFGAVIGKALRPISAGAGLIPVLVTLQ